MFQMGWWKNHQLAKHVDADGVDDDDNTDDALMMPSNTNHTTNFEASIMISDMHLGSFPLLSLLPSAKWFWVVG